MKHIYQWQKLSSVAQDMIKAQFPSWKEEKLSKMRWEGTAPLGHWPKKWRGSDPKLTKAINKS